MVGTPNPAEAAAPTTADTGASTAPDNSAAAPGPPVPEIHAMRHSDHAALAELPWHLPLADWPENLLGGLPRGISRHVVRYFEIGD